MHLVESSFGRSLFVLGGARSGKSRHAQAMAEVAAAAGTAALGTVGTTDGARLVYVATAQAFDSEMEHRIAQHRADRDNRWRTVEAPLALAEALADADRADSIMVVDCLTLWVSNLILADRDGEAFTVELLETLPQLTGRVIFVSNEVGLGIVPDNALARRFRDTAGRLHQRLAAQVDSVDMVLAGLVQRWKAPIDP